MRIIAGKHRGRVLKEFEGRDIRPTSDRAREALFNILRFDVPGACFLDLYSGVGGVGIEALSRGAQEVVFVDNSKKSSSILRDNLNALKETAQVVESDALVFVKTTQKKFDIVFLDPPYSVDAVEVAETVFSRSVLNDGGLLVYERSKDEKRAVFGAEKIDERRYGAAVFDFYVYKGN